MMSRGFLRGLSSKKVPPLLLSDGASVFAAAAAALSCERFLSAVWLDRESREILNSSVICSPSSWISCLEPSEAEGRESTFLSADRSVAVGSWGMGEAVEVGWGCGGLSFDVSPPPPPLLDSLQRCPSASDSSSSSDDSLLLLLLLSLEVLLLSLEALLLSPSDTEAPLEAPRSSSSATIVAASSSCSNSSSKSFFCREAFCNVAAKSVNFLDL